MGGPICTPLVTTGLTGTCSAAVPASAGGLLGPGMLWACTGRGVPVLFMTFVIAGVSKALWDSEEVGRPEVSVGEATGLEEVPAGKSRLGKACEGVVVLAGKELGPGAVTAFVMSGKRGAGSDWEETVMLGLPAKVMVTLVVSTAPDPIPAVDICGDRGRGEDSGTWGVVRRLAVSPLLAGGLRGEGREVRGSDPQPLLGGGWRQCRPLGGCQGRVQGRDERASWGDCGPEGGGPGSVLRKLQLLVTGRGPFFTGRQGLIAEGLSGNQNGGLHTWVHERRGSGEGVPAAPGVTMVQGCDLRLQTGTPGEGGRQLPRPVGCLTKPQAAPCALTQRSRWSGLCPVTPDQSLPHSGPHPLSLQTQRKDWMGSQPAGQCPTSGRPVLTLLAQEPGNSGRDGSMRPWGPTANLRKGREMQATHSLPSRRISV